MQIEREQFPDGVELAYVRWTPPGVPRGLVVCVHGIRSHAGWYENSCRHFAESGYLTFFLDRRASGMNRDVGGRAVSASLLVEDLTHFIILLRRKHPGLPVHLVGISWGGKLAVATLVRHPGLADSLTLVTPGIAARKDITAREKFMVLFNRLLRPRHLMPIPLNEPELFTANPERIEYIRRDRLSLTECPAALLWASFILDCRVRKAAGSLAVPLFTMLAEHDPIVDNERLMSFHAGVGATRKQLKLYSGAHHTLEFEPEARSIFSDMVNWFARFDRASGKADPDVRAPRVAVVYFSQTGNTEKVARALAEGLAGSGASVDVLDLLQTDPASLSKYDLMGVGTPVFYFREPLVVERFLARIGPGHAKPAFLFLTSGGHPSNTFFHMSRTLRKRGFLVVDAFACHGYDTYPPFKDTARFLGHPDAEELDQARGFGARLLDRTHDIQQGPGELIPVFKRHWDRFGRLSVILRNRLLAWLVLPRKILIAGKCTQCGLCVRHCPVQVIEMDPFPVFRRGCIDCTLCERICPTEAIRCDWTFIKKKMQSSEEEQGEPRHE